MRLEPFGAPRRWRGMSPLLPCVHSACPARTQPASAEGVRSNSRATAPTVRSSSRTSRPAPALNSSVNCRRTRRLVLLDPILDIVSASRNVSTRSDQAQTQLVAARDADPETGMRSMRDEARLAFKDVGREAANVRAAYDELGKAIKSETQRFGQWAFFKMGVLTGCVGGCARVLFFLLTVLGLREALEVLGLR